MDHKLPIVLFDGVCNLCNGWVNFAMDNARPGKRILFGAIQSTEGEHLIEKLNLQNGSLDSVILIQGKRVYRESDAILRIMRLMRAPWSWLYVFRILPRTVRDAVYRWVAKNRYKWFGVRDSCRLPNEETRGWFLENVVDAPANPVPSA